MGTFVLLLGLVDPIHCQLLSVRVLELVGSVGTHQALLDDFRVVLGSST